LNAWRGNAALALRHRSLARARSRTLESARERKFCGAKNFSSQWPSKALRTVGNGKK
jgi:hypothetical protein